MPMASFEQFRLMLAVARRELTSILRGKAERLLFIWTSLLFVPLVTAGMLTAFLGMRTTDVLHPVRVALPSSQRVELSNLAEVLKNYPEVQVSIVESPERCLSDGNCDATLRMDSKDKLSVSCENYAVQRRFGRVLESARGQAFRQITSGSMEGVLPFYITEVTADQYRQRADYLRQCLVAVYVLVYLYSVLWLIPAIDIVRFDFLQNNIYANLCLPVPMRVVTGGKVLSGIVMTLIPTALSSIAFFASCVAALLIGVDYYSGGSALENFNFVPRLALPMQELLLLPVVIISAIGFLHAWLTLVVVFFQGQRIASAMSTTSLFVFAQLEVAYGFFIPTHSIIGNCVPFFGLATVVHQILDSNLTWAGCALAIVSTWIAIGVLINMAGKCYRLESWTRWFARRPRAQSGSRA